MVKNPPANAGDAGRIPVSRRSPGERNGNLLRCPCLGNPMDRGAWWATVHGIRKTWTQLSAHARARARAHTHTHTHTHTHRARVTPSSWFVWKLVSLILKVSPPRTLLILGVHLPCRIRCQCHACNPFHLGVYQLPFPCQRLHLFDYSLSRQP